MTYQIVHDGLVREFELFAPPAWPYWLEQAHAIDGRRGLPLVIAMHGGGQEPAVFGAQWPFFTLLDPTCPNHLPAAEDKFFVLYPFGSSSSPKGTCDEPGNGSPLRGWNIGFSGQVVPAQDDASFIVSAVEAVEAMLQPELDRLGVALPAIDEHRRYAFGYSMGGMMAYRIAHDVPDYIAALWVMAGAHDGRAHHGLTTTVANTPRGTMRVSLFAHHGNADDVVPPGTVDNHGDLVVSAESLRWHEAAGSRPPMPRRMPARCCRSRAPSTRSSSTTTCRRHRPRRGSSSQVSIRRSGPSAGPTGPPTRGFPVTRRSSSTGTRRWTTTGSRPIRAATSPPRPSGTSSSTTRIR